MISIHQYERVYNDSIRISRRVTDPNKLDWGVTSCAMRKYWS
jgi:hypothetical protein